MKAGIVTYSSLASGFLAGKYSEGTTPAEGGRECVKQYCTTSGWRLLAALEAIAASHDVAMAAVSLAWPLAQDAVTGTIVGLNRFMNSANALQRARLSCNPGDRRTDAALGEMSRICAELA